jgi:hypothetical protein
VEYQGWSVCHGQNWLSDLSHRELNLKKQDSCRFHVVDRSESSNTYNMIIGRDLLGEIGIIHDHTFTWDTGTIPLKDRGRAL